MRFISGQTAKLSTAAGEYARVVLQDGIKTLTMCHTKTRNSLSIPMMETLIDHLQSDWSNPKLRVVVIEGEGPVFSAGHNLKELSPQLGKETHNKVFSLATTLMMTIVNSPVPILAKVDGVAAAAGCQLVAQCDLALCTEESSFATSGVNFGLFCSTPSIPLARCIDKSTVLKMLYTGRPILGPEALRSGLVAYCCPKSELDGHVQQVCEDIKAKSRSVIELGKRFYYKQIDQDLAKAYDIGAEVMVKNLHLPDGKEGVVSFLEKRKPVWSNE